MKTVNNFPFSSSNNRYEPYSFKVIKLEECGDNLTLNIKTPENPYAIGVVSVIQDSKGWNITKSIIKGNGGFKNVYYSGTDIQTIYLVTSVINQSTPYAPRHFEVPPYFEIEYTLQIGKVNSTDEIQVTLNLPFIFLVCSVILVVVVKKIKKNKMKL